MDQQLEVKMNTFTTNFLSLIDVDAKAVIALLATLKGPQECLKLMVHNV